jgi:predicted nucleic acid-binding protein
MNVLIDTNVALDVLLRRKPFEESASEILIMSENGLISGYISASSITDIFYLVRKEYKDTAKTYEAIKKLCMTVHIAAVDERAIQNALNMEWSDFEDCVQHAAAKDFQADYIITRDENGFKDGTIRLISPTNFVALIGADDKD